jgi:hypothetical protein
MRNDYELVFAIWHKVAAFVSLMLACYGFYLVYFGDIEAFNFYIALAVYQFGMWSVAMANLGQKYGPMTGQQVMTFFALPFILTPALLLLIAILFYGGFAIAGTGPGGLIVWLIVGSLMAIGPLICVNIFLWFKRVKS